MASSSLTTPRKVAVALLLHRNKQDNRAKEGKEMHSDFEKIQFNSDECQFLC